jgi:hypothetical protein
VDDFTEEEYEALSDALPGQEELTVEFAVVYWRKGRPVVEGPYPRRAAEAKAKARGGQVAERTRQVTFGLWTVADERMADADMAAEEDDNDA